MPYEVKNQTYSEFMAGFNKYCEMNAVRGVSNEAFLDSILANARRMLDNEYRTIEKACNGLRSVAHAHAIKSKRSENTNDNQNHTPSAASVNFTAFDDNYQGIKDARLNEISNINRQLPNNALDLVEQVCRDIQKEWNKQCGGLAIHIAPVKQGGKSRAQIECELQSVEAGKRFTSVQF